MSNKLLLSALLMAPGLLMASGPSPYKASKQTPFRYAYKSPKTLQSENEQRRDRISEMLAPKGMEKTSSIEVSDKLDPSSQFGYLEGPDGTIWYYTSNPVIEKIPVSGGYEGLTESIIREYNFSIYDSDLRLVGTIHDKIDIDEGALETKPAQVMLNSVVSKKFFNIDDKYELIVSVAMNRDLSQNPYPYINYHSYVYSLNGEQTEDGFDKKVKTIDGYLVESVNSAADLWSENFFMTFLTESADLELDEYEDFLNSCKYTLTTYSRASYSGDMSIFQQREVGLNHLPGDQMNCPLMLTFLHDGAACFAYMEYEKKFYATQGEFDPSTGELSDPIQSEDNNLIVTIFQDKGKMPTEIQKIKIPVEIDKTTSGALFTYYGVGNLRYDKDIDFGNFLGDNSKACVVVNKQVYTSHSDDYINSYYVYDPNGEQLITLSEGCDSFVELSDVKGQDPQLIFIYLNGEEYRLDFTELYSGTVTAKLGQTINGEAVSATIDRVPYGDSYRYAVSMLHGDTDADGNTIHNICWLDSDAKFIEKEQLNLGKDIVYANLYIDQSTLDPYFFDTDINHEYMVLVKRYTSPQHTELQEELLIVSTNGNTLLHLTPDSDKGNLITIAPVNIDTKPRLNVVYRSDDYKYTPEFYDLPLCKFTAGGDGTAENPYQIATIGDFKQIGSSLSSNYKLVADLDASNVEVTPVSGSFTGSLNGDGHSINNLTITPGTSTSGLFSRLDNNSKVSNLNIINAVVGLSEEVSRAGVLAAEASNATIDGVHVYNVTTSNGDSYDSAFGGIIGSAMLHTAISNCSVANASFNLPKASVGGIVGGMRTGVTVQSSSFNGSIKGASEVGGIVGSSITGDEKIADCHVDADIVANNIVGGIIGSSRRSNVTRCYVEGTVEATTPDRWTDAGPCAGGIVGQLSPSAATSEGVMAHAPATEGVVTNNIVRIESLKGYTPTGTPSHDQQFTTIHRIVGWTRVNDEPDPSVDTSADKGLANNYAISTLNRFSSDVDDADTSTEGKSIADSDLNRDFFENTLGMQFGAENPWNELAETDPALNHETSAFFNPVVLTPEENTTFEATLVIVSRTQIDPEAVVSDFSCESSDEDVAAPTGNFHFDGNNMVIEFSCSRVGTAVVTAYVNGAQAKFTVNSKVSGVNEVVGNEKTLISYNGTNVKAQECAITIYNLSGTAVASAHDNVSVADLQKGIYLAVAVDGEGSRQVLKIIVR